MTDNEIVKKVEYGLLIKSELSELEFKKSASNIPNDIWKSI